jgi:hypothetical protein
MTAEAGRIIRSRIAIFFIKRFYQGPTGGTEKFALAKIEPTNEPEKIREEIAEST